MLIPVIFNQTSTSSIALNMTYAMIDMQTRIELVIIFTMSVYAFMAAIIGSKTICTIIQIACMINYSAQTRRFWSCF